MRLSEVVMVGRWISTRLFLEEETVETVGSDIQGRHAQLKLGVNEMDVKDFGEFMRVNLADQP
jgi:hypothetical protein